MKTRVLLEIVFVIGVAVIGFAYFTTPNDAMVVSTAPAAQTTHASASAGSASTQTQPAQQNAQPSQSTQTQGYTMSQVAAHNSASSCWAAINGKVYNLTSWINQHPGGPGPILSLCGTDGSAAFNAQHGGQRRPESELANFYLGPLQ
jgi:cytochrome b involved in lipid metabolism